MIRQYGAQRSQGGDNPLRVGVVSVGSIFYLQDETFFHDRHGGLAVCRTPWIVEGFLNGTMGAARRNRDTSRWEDAFRSGRSDMALVRSLRDRRLLRQVAVRTLILHEDLGLNQGRDLLPDVARRAAAPPGTVPANRSRPGPTPSLPCRLTSSPHAPRPCPAGAIWRGKGAAMVTILGLRLPHGYVADRHPGHIAVSLHGTLLGVVPHDIAPRELEARVNRHLFAGSSDVLPASGAPAAGARFVNRFPEHDRDEADQPRTTPAGLEWLVSHVADDHGGPGDIHLICEATGVWISPSAAELWVRFTTSA